MVKAIRKIELIVIGVSSGSAEALKEVLSPLPSDFGIPIVIVRHQLPDTDDYIIRFLGNVCQLKVKYAENNEEPVKGWVYLAPPDRHIEINKKRRFDLLVTPKVNYSRPSVDNLFVSAAAVYGPHIAGVILTGANEDGAKGLKVIKNNGGITVVQNPKSAQSSAMPDAAIGATQVEYVIWLDQIGPFLWDIYRKNRMAGESFLTNKNTLVR